MKQKQKAESRKQKSRKQKFKGLWVNFAPPAAPGQMRWVKNPRWKTRLSQMMRRMSAAERLDFFTEVKHLWVQMLTK